MANLKILPARAEVALPLSGSVRVGKDILGLLGAAMYTEPLAIVREYVQNAADSIDSAYTSGILSGKRPGRIEISTDLNGRSLRIRDNGIGIERRNVEDVLVAFGASGKRGTAARGFRGIGRLGGLGFAQRVVFRTRFVGESQTSEIAWDCRSLRAILSDPHERSNLSDVVRSVVSVRALARQDVPEHFFEVELESLARLRNDRLLNPDVLTSYLRQVAPLPFHSSFDYGARIEAFVEEFVPRQRIDISVNGSEPLSRPHRNSFTVTGNKTDKFSELQLQKFDGLNGGLAAVGWILHHGYRGALKASPEIRGLRARLGDLQVGDEGLFVAAFREPRFNSWVVGELHILDRAIIPNGRRDDFESGAAYSHLLNQLAPVGRILAHRCRTSSLQRAMLRRFEDLEDEVLLSAKRIRQRRVTGRRMRMLLSDARAKVVAMQSLLARCSSNQRVIRDLRGRLHGCQSMLGRATQGGGVSPLASLPTHRRALFEDFLELLRSCIPSRKNADALVERITKRLVRKYLK
jgi:hypothetical protein